MAGLTPEQGRVLLTSKHHDLTLIYNEVQFKVHKGIVCVISPLIDELCSARPDESCSQVPDLAINPVAHPRLLQHIYTGSHPEVGSPLLLQNVPNPTTVKDTRSRPEVLNVPKDGAILSEAKSGVPTQVSGNTTAVNRSSADSNAGPGQSDNEIGCQDQPIGASLNSVITTGTDADRLATSMRNEFEVYVCAKALGVGGVMKGAKGRVLHLVSAIFAGFNSLTGFSKVLAFIFESTKSGQDVLREEVTASCLERYHQCSNNAAVAAVIEDFEPTLWRIAVPLLRKTAAGRDASIVATRLAVQVFPALRARNLRVTTSGGSGAFSFETSTYTKPAAELFGKGTPTVKSPQNGSHVNGNKAIPLAQTQQPVPPATTQILTPTRPVSFTEGVNGSTGSHN